MAIRITCPGCETSLTLSEDKRGKKVRCRACEKVLSIPAINGKASKHAEEEEDEEKAVQDEPRLKVKPGRKNDEDDEDEESDRPAKKKKKKKKKGAPIVLIASLAVVFLLLVGAGALVTYFLTRPREPQAKVQQQEQPQPPPQPGRLGGDVVKNPKTLLGNIRARGAQIERDKEMVGIVELYHAYYDEVKNPSARNLDSFLLSIRTAPGTTVNKVKNKEYLINYKARIDGGDVVVYESERYDQGYFCFCADKQSAYLSPEQMKAAGLAVPAAP